MFSVPYIPVLPLNALATYNAEVSRGIVHTEEYKEKMAKAQKEYNDGLVLSAKSKGMGVIG